METPTHLLPTLYHRHTPANTHAEEKKLATLGSTLDQATREYNHVNQLLKQQLPQFFQLKEAFVTPCFQTIFLYQHKMYEVMHSALAQVVQGHYDSSQPVLTAYQQVQPGLEDMLKSLTVIKRYAEKLTSMPELQAEGVSSAAVPPPAYEEAGSPRTTLPAMEKLSLGGAAAAYASSASPFTSRPIPPPPPAAAPAPELLVTACYDFEAQAPGDLSFREGDRITVIKKTDSTNDW